MKILRYIFATLFLLLTLGIAFVAYVALFPSTGKPIIISVFGQVISIGYLFAGGALVTFIISVILLPVGGGKGSKGKKKGKGGKKDQKLSASQAKAELAKMRAQGSKFGQQKQDSAVVFSDVDIIPDPSVDTYSRLEDPEAMARLVAIEQGDLNRHIVTELLEDYYPDLIELVDRVIPEDKSSLETIGRHIISIARNRLKLTDKSLSDNQFSIFQENVFSEEKKSFLQIYKPTSRGLSVEQRAFIGKVCDKRAWESIQRQIRGERKDWYDLSLDNATELLK